MRTYILQFMVIIMKAFLFVFNFMLKHFELVKCPLCSSFCCVLLIFLYGIKGCFLSKIYGLNILLNQHPTHCCSNGDRAEMEKGFSRFPNIQLIRTKQKNSQLYCDNIKVWFQEILYFLSFIYMVLSVGLSNLIHFQHYFIYLWYK